MKQYGFYLSDTYSGYFSVLTVLGGLKFFMAYKLIFQERRDSVETLRTPTLRRKVALATVELPALYFFNEILALHKKNTEDLRQIHQTKLAYPGIRVLQD
jgi:hypothetical protein